MPCKFLDFETEYLNCKIKQTDGIKHWYRNYVPYADAPRNVQFCKQRGRINNIYDCAYIGKMSCYEEDSDNK